MLKAGVFAGVIGVDADPVVEAPSPSVTRQVAETVPEVPARKTMASEEAPTRIVPPEMVQA
jgi:hypothetical protein